MMQSFSQRIQSVALGLVVLSSLGIPLALAEDGAANTTPANDAQSVTGQPTDQQKACPHQGCKSGCKKHDGKKRGHHKGDMLKSLNLSDAQEKQMKALNETFQQENAALIQSLKSRHQQLKELGKGDETKDQRKQLHDAMKQDRDALHAKRMALMQQVLTPAQMTQFETTLAQRKAERQQKWQERHQQGQPEGKPASPQ